jgi:D-alanyl-lipoteichoic acid acyltransferase DltB (MBOAT superfamily)
MSFTSLQFLVFFPTVLFLNYALPPRYRGYFLLCASYFFYASWNPYYVALIVLITVTSYLDAFFIERAKPGTRKKWTLIVAVTINILVIAVFKYYNFFVGEASRLVGHAYSPADWFYLNVLLPLGISFHVFQCIGYHVDVYYQRRPVERNLPAFALFVVFFPQLVAGPIERSTTLLPQLKSLFVGNGLSSPQFDYSNVTAGLRLMLLGFVKKLVVADQLAVFVDPIFRQPAGFTAVDTMIGAAFFGLQIYFDFSGYTDIARGAAQTLGFRLMENFNLPYLARSIGEFWHRWHISLTSWFRDYVYIPMGGNRVSEIRWSINVMTVFMLSGLWHGANWTFVWWGALHGGMLIVGRMTQERRARARSYLGLDRYKDVMQFPEVVVTFALVTIAWVFFRAESVFDALSILKSWVVFLVQLFPMMFGKGGGRLVLENSQMPAIILNQATLFCVIGAVIIACESIKSASLRSGKPIDEFLRFSSAHLRWATYYAAAVLIVLSGGYGARQFIYFQF